MDIQDLRAKYSVAGGYDGVDQTLTRLDFDNILISNKEYYDEYSDLPELSIETGIVTNRISGATHLVIECLIIKSIIYNPTAGPTSQSINIDLGASVLVGAGSTVMDNTNTIGSGLVMPSSEREQIQNYKMRKVIPIASMPTTPFQIMVGLRHAGGQLDIRGLSFEIKAYWL